MPKIDSGAFHIDLFNTALLEQKKRTCKGPFLNSKKVIVYQIYFNLIGLYQI